ncbi:hypothetical protein LTR97_009351 [Elasticomyces elasticus]|uniref:Uncharacterized protein n=1 Tax=Elasticomyces elasticus TaxID=574655 RepID=A0AAN8A1B3_9PEZI|nr:hypothetical protein LTR97_009351 [Elasticomyces elasticus]
MLALRKPYFSYFSLTSEPVMSLPAAKSEVIQEAGDRPLVTVPYSCLYQNVNAALKRKSMGKGDYSDLAGWQWEQRNWIEKMMVALNGPVAGPPEEADDQQIMSLWREGQNRFKWFLAEELGAPGGMDKAEKSMWLLLDHVYKLHSPSFTTPFKSDPSFKTAPRRLERIIAILTDYPRLGLRIVMNDIDLDLFAADPETIVQSFKDEIFDFIELKDPSQKWRRPENPAPSSSTSTKDSTSKTP